MQAGDLKHLITIQSNASDGTTPDDWQTFCTVHAARKGATGRLYYAAAAAQSQNEVVFTIRYRTGITPVMHIVEDGDTDHPYKIVSEPVDPYDDKMWLEIHAQRTDLNGG